MVCGILRTLGRRVILIGDISLQLRGRIIFWLLTLMIVNFGLVRMMQIKKAGGKIFGASLTAAEQKAMNMEIQRQLVEYDRKNELELDAIILWELHTQLGLGPKRLKKFFDGFSDALNALVNRYEMDISDDFWLCTHKLKEIGVDVEDWYRQKE